MQKAYERAGEQVAPLLAILERRLAGEGVPPGGGPGSRDLLDALADIGQERFPAIADLARELRYRRYDQPAIARTRSEIYAQIEADLARLGAAQGEEREEIVRRLVEVAQPFVTMLLERTASAPAALRPRLVETLLRRYYRARPLAALTAAETDGVPTVIADYEHGGESFRIAACFALAAEAPRAAAALARRAAEVPTGREIAVELYLWDEAPGEPDAQAEALREALARAEFTRPVLRASAVVALPRRGLGRQASQRHFTFVGDGAWTEDARYRGVHPMLFRRLQLGRLARFDLERLPSVEDVYLYRGVARENPKDERLFAAAEIREIAPVRDEQGRVVQLPHVERVLHEALAGMRRFQARRAAEERLEWNRVLLTVAPPLPLTRDEIRTVAERNAAATEGLGLEMVLLDARLPDPRTGELRETLVRIVVGDRGEVSEHRRRRRAQLHREVPRGDDAGRCSATRAARWARSPSPSAGASRRLDLAEELGCRSSGSRCRPARRSRWTRGTENMDWIAPRAAPDRRVHPGGRRDQRRGHRHQRRRPAVLERRGDDADAHQGHPVMTPTGAMVLTGKQALDYSGGVSAEDNFGIGGYDRIMGPNGQAQYWAPTVADACRVLLRHYDHTYVAPGERFPRRAPPRPVDRDVRASPHAGLERHRLRAVGDVFSDERTRSARSPSTSAA
jgi:hypothetical protein